MPDYSQPRLVRKSPEQEAIERRQEEAIATAKRKADRRATIESNNAVMQSILDEAAARGVERDAAAELARQAEEQRQQVAFRDQAQALFFAQGGTEVDFAIQWPSIHAELLRQRTVRAMEAESITPDPVSAFINRRNGK